MATGQEARVQEGWEMLLWGSSRESVKGLPGAQEAQAPSEEDHKGHPSTVEGQC